MDISANELLATKLNQKEQDRLADLASNEKLFSELSDTQVALKALEAKLASVEGQAAKKSYGLEKEVARLAVALQSSESDVTRLRAVRSQ